MKAVILAGGLGTRFSEETDLRPKPMIEIGGRPLLWHIMRHYAAHDIRDFVICLGYKGYVVKEYFLNYFAHNADLRLNLGTGTREILSACGDVDWTVTLIDTGADSMTGGRLKRVAPHLRDGGTFCMTYGDGLSDLDLSSEIAFHRAHGKLATVAAIPTPSRFGVLRLVGDRVDGFSEKTESEDGSRINGGFFVLEPAVLDRIDGDDTVFEKLPLRGLADDGELRAFEHNGFWQPCDTLREKRMLESLWNRGDAPWAPRAARGVEDAAPC